MSATKELETDSAIFTAAGKLLASVADSLRSAHHEHAALQQYLLDLQHKADALPPDGATSPAAADLANQSRATVADAAKLLTKVRTEDEETANKLKSVSAGPLGPITFLSAVSGDQRKPIEEILREYQVTPDPNGMVTFPDGAKGWIAEQLGLEPQEMTAGEAELLSELGPWVSRMPTTSTQLPRSRVRQRSEGKANEMGMPTHTDTPTGTQC